MITVKLTDSQAKAVHDRLKQHTGVRKSKALEEAEHKLLVAITLNLETEQ